MCATPIHRLNSPVMTVFLDISEELVVTIVSTGGCRGISPTRKRGTRKNRPTIRKSARYVSEEDVLTRWCVGLVLRMRLFQAPLHC